jgi:Kef-type K+ transport system membrane component KefB
MRKVLVYSLLLVTGLVGAQFLPSLPAELHAPLTGAVQILTMVCLAFVMIHVGYEFEIDRSNLRGIAWDYFVATTAAALPWLLCAGWVGFVLQPAERRGDWQAWKESLLTGLFAAPTSAGILFAMLAAAGLSATWLFRKARVLAVFDDLQTVLLMIPLKALIIGLHWQLGVVVVIMVGLVVLAWTRLRTWRIPVSWPWVLGYSAVIVALSEALYLASKQVNDLVPIHIEVLLPAFALGCLMAHPAGADPHRDDARPGHQEGPESPEEQRVATIVSGVFMVLVGLSMPSISSALGGGSAGTLLLHVLAMTVLANLGKMFPLVCYRREAGWRERLALCVGMWPRGEVGAGVLVVALGYGIGGLPLAVGGLCLAVNLVLTGGFIWVVKRLLAASERAQASAGRA